MTEKPEVDADESGGAPRLNGRSKWNGKSRGHEIRPEGALGTQGPAMKLMKKVERRS